MKADVPHTIPLESLRPLGDWLAALADQCHDDAATHEHREARRARIERQADARSRRQENAAGVLAFYLVNGNGADQAVRATARVTGLEIMDLERVLGKAHQEAARRLVNRRHRRVMQLRAQGLTDPQIGKRTGYHPKHVARIIGQELRRTA